MTVTVYSKPSCVQCTATYRGLDSKGVEYNVVDVTTSEEALSYVYELGHKAAPVVVVSSDDGQVVDHWSQFRAEKIASLAN